MAKIGLFIAVILIIASGSIARDMPSGSRTLPDPTTFPINGAIHCLPIVDYSFAGSDLTNCYIIAGVKGEAIIIDPADELEQEGGKTPDKPLMKILADKETGESMLVSAETVKRYPVISTNSFGIPTIVRNPTNGRQYIIYDQFQTTNKFGPKIFQFLKDHKLKLKYIVITHGHLDHFGALTYLQQKTGAKVLMHENDLRTLTGGKLVSTPGVPLEGYPKDSYRIIGLSTKVDQLLKDGDLITLDGMVLQVIHTPGHSPGSICLRTRQGKKTILFSGDTLLRWGYLFDYRGDILKDENGNPVTADSGRTNFIDGSGNAEMLNCSIRDKLLILPDDTTVYPGHSDSTTIGEEKKNGPPRAKENTSQ